MDVRLEEPINTIIDSSQRLLSEATGTLNDKQKRYIYVILANAERFVHMATEFSALPREEVTKELRHAIGNPLTPIQGYVELMRTNMAENLNESQHACVTCIQQATADLRNIVDSMVQESRAAARRST